MVTKRNTDWDDDRVEPLKGPKGDTAFLKENYKLMGSLGGSFRTPKARFTHKRIHAGAEKAGFRVRIDDEGLWLKVTVIGKLPPKAPIAKKPATYKGAGKKYPGTIHPTTDIFS